MKEQDLLADISASAPGLPIWTSSTDGFESLAKAYHHTEPPYPLAIVRPRNEEDVVTVVKYATSSSIPLAVRSGGHDYRGRSLAAEALVIDMRDLKEVTTVDDGQAAVIGGDILNKGLSETLGKTGQATAVGYCGTVGYVGWATHGGYGAYHGAFGLGVDQILGARVVNCKGEVLDADEELLYCIRGAGSAFGVIVSLKIKIYKLEKILTGALAYAVGLAVDESIAGVLAKYHEFHELASHRNSASTLSGQEIVEDMAKIGPVAMNMVFETTPAAWMQAQQQNIPAPGAHLPVGYTTFTVQRLDADVRDLLVKHTKLLPPNLSTLWFEHRIHGAACRPSLPSCFACRDPHVMIEVLGCSATKEDAEVPGDWAKAFHGESRRLPQTLKGGYVPLVSSEILLESCYAGHWERLQKLKAKFDPRNVFRNSITGLGDA